ncbi:MAG TPA: flagellar motor protein MotB [Terriglobales bacterium]|nr:flagellar motor protein MotB [Terriglobales bacterium]
MSRRRRHQEHAGHERWLVSYADFITLLFAFFVVLYASSQMDKKKVVQVSAAIKGAFEQLGAFSGNAAYVHADPPLDPSGTAIQPERSGIPGIDVEGMPDVNALKRELQEALGEQIEKHEIEIHSTPEGLVVSLREIGFFNSGEATLLPEGRATLTRIAGVLNEKRFQVRVEGNTDNIPIHTDRFKSNWELSTARATEVVALLVEQHGFNPTLISAAGYSEYRPRASNKTEDGRKQNRRVDLVIVAHVAEKTAAKASPVPHKPEDSGP